MCGDGTDRLMLGARARSETEIEIDARCGGILTVRGRERRSSAWTSFAEHAEALEAAGLEE